MLKNYIKTALRSLWRHKGFSFLNIAGLAIGMAAFFLIAQYVRLETSYDAFVPQKERIYRLDCDIKSASSNLSWALSVAPMAINLKKDYPEVNDFVRLNPASYILRRGNKKFQEDNTVMADSSLFRIFNYPLLQGDSRTALKEPFSLVLSRTTAIKYFGDANPLGQTLYIGVGLASYSTLQRTKEIGVRRVLGASVTGVVRLLSADFLKLVALAFLISCPIAWFAMHRWLQDFAYRTSLSWWVFLGSGSVAVVIAFATIGYQAIKAATASPVKSLRLDG